MPGGTNRLAHKRDFDRLFQAGRAVHHPLCTLRFAPNDLSVLRVGFMCGKRVGGAVVRNLSRRRFRHALRTLTPALTGGWDILVVIRPKSADAHYVDIADALRELLRRSGLVTN